MKKIFFVLFIIIAIFSVTFMEAQTAPKKGGKGALKAEELTQMSDTIDALTRKVYAHSLFSPKDNEALIAIKIKLDNQMLVSPDVTLAPLYYKVGKLYKLREYKDEAIDCFQTILENFVDKKTNNYSYFFFFC